MSKLTTPIQRAVSEALQEADGDPERQAEIFETLCTSTAMCVSVSAKGNAAKINELCDGASNYILERAINFQKLGAFMAAVTGVKPK
jgi:hypothetical protein